MENLKANKVLVEEFLTVKKFFHCVMEKIIKFQTAQDHKRVNEGDEGKYRWHGLIVHQD